MTCSSGLRMVSLKGTSGLLIALISVSWMKPAPFYPSMLLIKLFFSSSISCIHSLASCTVSQVKFHSIVSNSPLAFFPVCLTSIMFELFGFLKTAP